MPFSANEAAAADIRAEKLIIIVDDGESQNGVCMGESRRLPAENGISRTTGFDFVRVKKANITFAMFGSWSGAVSGAINAALRMSGEADTGISRHFRQFEFNPDPIRGLPTCVSTPDRSFCIKSHRPRRVQNECEFGEPGSWTSFDLDRVDAVGLKR